MNTKLLTYPYFAMLVNPDDETQVRDFGNDQWVTVPESGSDEDPVYLANCCVDCSSYLGGKYYGTLTLPDPNKAYVMLAFNQNTGISWGAEATDEFVIEPDPVSNETLNAIAEQTSQYIRPLGPVLLNSTEPIPFALPSTGLSVTMLVAKGTAAEANAIGVVTEIGNNLYRFVPDAGDTDTPGTIQLVPVVGGQRYTAMAGVVVEDATYRIALAVWNILSATAFEEGSMGTLLTSLATIIGQQFPTVAAIVNALAGREIIIVNPFAEDGTISIVQGDDYLSSIGNAIVISVSEYSGPSLVGASVSFVATRRSLYEADPQTMPTVSPITGSIVTAGDGVIYTIEIPKAVTSLMSTAPAEDKYNYDYQVYVTYIDA